MLDDNDKKKPGPFATGAIHGTMEGCELKDTDVSDMDLDSEPIHSLVTWSLDDAERGTWEVSLETSVTGSTRVSDWTKTLLGEVPEKVQRWQWQVFPRRGSPELLELCQTDWTPPAKWVVMSTLKVHPHLTCTSSCSRQCGGMIGPRLPSKRHRCPCMPAL